MICACTALAILGCAGGAPRRQPVPSSAGSSPGPVGAAAPLTLNSVLALNPALNANGYALRPGPESGLSLWAPTGAGQLELVVNAAHTVVAVRGVFPTSTGLQPWYDQAHGGTAAAQTGAVARPTPGSRTTPYSISSGTAPNNTSGPAAVAPNEASLVGSGTAAPTSGTSAATVYTETLWLVPRSQAATGPTSIPQYQAIAGLNPAMSQARAQTRFIPGAGVYFGPRGYGLLAMADRGGRLVGVTGWFPLGAGWQPFYDQMPGHEDLAPQWFLKGFTQHLWLVAPSDVR